MARTKTEWANITMAIQTTLNKAVDSIFSSEINDDRLNHLREAARRTKELQLYIQQEFNEEE